jgi:hypothetical protein
MIPVGGGLYKYQQVFGPGWYQWKAVVTGSWDAIGDDFRGVNANTTWFEATATHPMATFWVNALNGSIYVVVPEPSTAALLGLAGLALWATRRSRK